MRAVPCRNVVEYLLNLADMFNRTFSLFNDNDAFGQQVRNASIISS